MTLAATVPTFEYGTYAQAPVPACPVCGTTNPSVPARDRYGYAIGTSQCDCGFGYLNPQLSAEGYDAFYATAYRPLVIAANRLVALPTNGRRRGKWMGMTLLAVRPRRTAFHTGCDVGGSHGAVTEGFCRVWPVTTMTVIDPNPAELAQAATRGFHTIRAQVEQYPSLPPQDVLLCAQTLDHVRDPQGVLAWLYAQAGGGGWLYVDCVDAPKWARRRCCPTRVEWKLDHPGYWTPATLDRAVKQAGWRIRARGPYGYHYALWCQKEQQTWQ